VWTCGVSPLFHGSGCVHATKEHMRSMGPRVQHVTDKFDIHGAISTVFFSTVSRTCFNCTFWRVLNTFFQLHNCIF
jgi:hypothetical protein